MPDTALIKQLCADEYGMKHYALVFLKPGQTQQTDPFQAAEIQKQHLKYLKNLMDEGTMLILGPGRSRYKWYLHLQLRCSRSNKTC